MDSNVYVAIQQLYARYAMTIDACDVEGWLDCFTPNSSFTSLTGATFTGTDGLRNFAEALVGQQRTHRHWNGQIRLEEVDTATVRGGCYCLLVDVSTTEPRITRSVTYHDLIDLRSGQPLFSRRLITADDTVPLSYP